MFLCQCRYNKSAIINSSFLFYFPEHTFASFNETIRPPQVTAPHFFKSVTIRGEENLPAERAIDHTAT